MTEKVFLITDLGGGDGGKGGVVHKTCLVTGAHTVVKVGGAQGSHGVRTSKGQSFNFSQFGCGSLEGIRTHISNRMVVEPLALLHEAELLKYGHGLRDIFSLLTVDENALCVTPFHRIASQLRELARKDKPKGTVGTGVGEAVADSLIDRPDLELRVKDIVSGNLYGRLEGIRSRKIYDVSGIMSEDFLEADREKALELWATLQNESFSEYLVKGFREAIAHVTVVPSDYLGEEILSRDGTVVVETSHGVLTDKYYGFHPHTTQLRTMPQVTLDLLKEQGFNGKVVRLGVTRAYQIRHGAGPMVTEDPTMLENLLPGSNKDENRWQGKVRVGPLDLVALRYAINACGGPHVFDGLAITWFDQISRNGVWPVCDRYNGTEDRNFFSETGEILVYPENGYFCSFSLSHQSKLGEHLRQCTPEITSHTLPAVATQENLIALCGGVLQEKLGVPVKMMSFGPTEDDKVCI